MDYMTILTSTEALITLAAAIEEVPNRTARAHLLDAMGHITRSLQAPPQAPAVVTQLGGVRGSSL